MAHKYVRKYMGANGEWVYVYKDKSKSIFDKTRTLRVGSHGESKQRDNRKFAKEERASQSNANKVAKSKTFKSKAAYAKRSVAIVGKKTVNSLKTTSSKQIAKASKWVDSLFNKKNKKKTNTYRTDRLR